MSIDATLGDIPFTKVWPNNTTPVPLDGVGASALILNGASISNGSASIAYVRLFDGSASPTMGTSSPAVVLPVPANGELNRDMPRGIRFENGCWLTVTQGIAPTDNTAVAANVVAMTLQYRN